MPKSIHLKNEVEIPSDINVVIDGKRVKIQGPLGVIEKDFSHLHNIIIEKGDDNKIIIESWFPSKKEQSLVNTVALHLKNAFIGVQKGYRYKMKIVYAHFPMSLKVDEKNNIVIIENFLGSRDKKYAKILPGVKVKVQKDDVIIEGINIDAVGQTAANIHLAAKLRGKRRLSPHGREGGPGILDGIYLYAKENIK
ncbi:MAG: 50S ribosomal protein L6 [Thermoproteales archaeon]|nr:50S ribosomal protein L6 [Thermoproteales archaeon]